MSASVIYCDNCGEMVYQAEGFTGHAPYPGTQKDYRVFAVLPFHVASASAGESGVVCVDCIDLIDTEE